MHRPTTLGTVMAEVGGREVEAKLKDSVVELAETPAKGETVNLQATYDDTPTEGSPHGTIEVDALPSNLSMRQLKILQARLCRCGSGRKEKNCHRLGPIVRDSQLDDTRPR